MTRITIIAAAGALLLAGCSDSSSEPDAKGAVTVKEAAEKASAEMPRPEPGLYKTTVIMTGLDIPGLPEDMKQHGAGMTTTTEDCLTDEDVDKGYGELVKQGQNGDCVFEKFDAAGGKIDAVMVCKSAGPEKRMAISGTTSKTGADLTASVAMDFEGAGKGTLNFTTKHERIGECPAKK